MSDSFLAYIQRVELLAFFSGYPLLYAIIVLSFGNKPKNKFFDKLPSLLPFAYALVGTLYLGLQFKNLSILHATAYTKQLMLHPYLVAWGLLSLLFWIPAISKHKQLSLLHSLVFFFFLVKDIISQVAGSIPDIEMLNNDMRVFTVSLLMNTGAFIIIAMLFFIFPFAKKNQQNK